MMKTKIWITCLSIFLCILLIIGYLYFQQEKLLFQYVSLPENYIFSLEKNCSELFFEREKGVCIHALHFTTTNPKGVVIYFHGRGGNLANHWGRVAKDFTARNYDVFIMDYRSFGKSKGTLSENAIYSDASYCYHYLCSLYSEKQIIIYGRSLGTGIATYVASKHHPKNLILESPYFNMLDLTARHFHYFPNFLISLILKYHFRTDQWIVCVDSPIHIFHGTQDELIPFDSSTRLVKLMEEKDISLIPIKDGKHNHLRSHQTYQKILDHILQSD